MLLSSVAKKIATEEGSVELLKRLAYIFSVTTEDSYDKIEPI